MSSTFFTATPHWRWLIVAYFFLGGLAGGSYFLATLMDLFGKREDRPLVRLAYLIAFPAVCVCGLLLTADLGRPERFWHMLVQAQTFRPMVKAYSPMSIGSWALLLFGGHAIHSFVATMIFGVVLVGTYTSVFIAAPILIYLGVGTSRLATEEPPPKAGEQRSRRPIEQNRPSEPRTSAVSGRH